ncbi:MAG: malate synthase A [Dokdonella sp.]|uniref:malate synthase A n=1 Tax=Dokdonella sp. TaxID=2291710 RepID=UPI0025BF4AE5|nr:malate synthase A [Dokdonella sp.]MBZ0221913.1 malate synthase A [Dokdonella sp.]MCC7256679.1 malate synthase A [Dokdonella sp.]
MAQPASRLLPAQVEIRAAVSAEASGLLSESARAFLADLHRQFEPRRRALLHRRSEQQARRDAGVLPDFRADTRAIRDGDWRVAPIPSALLDRRVEITGPVERKMIINALNSGARVFMADFEDSTAPTFTNLLDGQRNLRDAVAGSIEYTSPEGKRYRVGPDPAVLMVRPRGWHLPEAHFEIDGEPMSGALFDFGLFAFHNAATLQARDRGPYFYLPKLECHEEAALWDAVLRHTEMELGLPRGAMKVTVLIETLPAVFEMDEILYALRERVTGLNCGRWDYIFSYIKTLRAHPDRVLPERGQVVMSVPFLKAYSELLIRTCHRRGAFAMGGMAAQIPINGDAQANAAALDKVRADKRREVDAGHDGTWVAHPALVPVAREIFDAQMPKPNQRHVSRADVVVDRDTLLAPCVGSITRAGFAANIEICLRYLAAWLDGQGCVPIHHLMEDAATAEISRAQLWQWLHIAREPRFDDGGVIELEGFACELESARARLSVQAIPGQSRVRAAAALLDRLTRADVLADFLTLAAIDQLAAAEGAALH